MKYSYYYLCDNEGRSNCVIRSFCKLYNLEYNDVLNSLLSIKDELNCDSFNDVVVFEEFMKRHNTFKLDKYEGELIRNLRLDNNSYIIFCYDKKDFFHMVPVINNTVYDYNEDFYKLYVINIYKLNP